MEIIAFHYLVLMNNMSNSDMFTRRRNHDFNNYFDTIKADVLQEILKVFPQIHSVFHPNN